MNRLDEVKSFLRNKSIKISNEWIVACIEYVISENIYQEKPIETQYLNQQVYEQWLHADLMTLGTVSQCLPSNLKNIVFVKLDGIFSLQINQVCDVGVPSYSLLQKFQKDDIENSNVSADKTFTAAWELKPSRMLMMVMTDGVTTVKGMEYTNIPSLSLNIKPGTKVIVKGPLESRRGVLLLTKENIVILGGFVDDILKKNAVMNVLKRKLNLPETDHPDEVPDNLISQPNAQTTSFSTAKQLERNGYIKRDAPLSMKKNKVNDDFDDDFEDFFDDETERVLLEAESIASNNIKTEVKPNSFDGFDSNDDEDFMIVAELTEKKLAQQSLTCNSISSNASKIYSSNPQREINLSTNICNSSSVIKDKNNSKSSIAPFEYFCNLDFRSLFKKTCIVKGFVITLKSKLKQDNGLWNLVAAVNDGTSTCEVFFGNQVLHNLIGLSVKEYQEQKENAKSSPEIKKALFQRVIKCQTELITLSCLFKIEVGCHLEMPKVIQLIPVTETHYSQLSERMFNM